MTLPTSLLENAQSLGASLVVGLLIGLERGWRERGLPDGGRVAGLRTFGLIGLLGGVLSLLAPLHAGLIGFGLTAVAVLFAVSYARFSASARTLSITSAVAGLTTFGLGALAAQGQIALATGAAVVVALLLDLKNVLHGWLRLIKPAELNAVLQMGVLTAVVLPLLPDAGYGPYLALNPYQLWLAVVLIAALSLLGHVTARLWGERQGLLWMGLLGGVASSTAATLSIARTATDEPTSTRAAAAGILAACAMMFVRMAVVIGLLQPALAFTLGGFLLWLAGVSFVCTALQWPWRSVAKPVMAATSRLFDLPTALTFGAILGLVAVLARASHDVLGAGGIYGVAFISGLADVDAMLISSMQMLAQDELPTGTAIFAILLAVAANMVTKAVMAWSLGGRALGLRVVAGYLVVAAAGLAGVVALKVSSA